MPEKIGIYEVLSRLVSCVEYRGEGFNYRDQYARCEYYVDGEPASLIGLGFSDVIPEGAHGDINSLWYNETLGLLDKFEWNALDIMSTAQTAQDHNNTWGYAVKLAFDRAAQRGY